MVTLKGYTTIEALISSVLILLVVSVSMIIFLGVSGSVDSDQSFKARTSLHEIVNNTNSLQEGEIPFENYSIVVTESRYKDFNDLTLFTLTAYDQNKREITGIRIIRKKGDDI